MLFRRPTPPFCLLSAAAYIRPWSPTVPGCFLEDRGISRVRLDAGGKSGRCRVPGSPRTRGSVCAWLPLFSVLFQLPFLCLCSPARPVLLQMDLPCPCRSSWVTCFLDLMKWPSCLQGVSCSVALSADGHSDLPATERTLAVAALCSEAVCLRCPDK